MKFKSKVDWFIQIVFALMVGLNIWGIVGLIGGDIGWIIAVAVVTPLNAFLLLPMWFNTYYLVENGELLVKCGLGRGTRIPIEKIKSVTPSRNPISSPALSLDRLEVRYNTGSFFDTAIISPRDKQGFMDALKAVNENIDCSNEKIPMQKSMKILLGSVGVVLVLTAIGVGALFYFGEREPRVSIYDDHIRIRAMYGTTVEFSNISHVILEPQSMREIGAGARTNGYNGWAWRGNFRAGLLFVRPDSTPTIRIERVRGSDIFISFRDSDQTVELFYDLIAPLTGR